MFSGMNRKKKKTKKSRHFSTRSKSRGRVSCMRRGKVSSEKKRVSSPHFSSEKKRVLSPHFSSDRNRTLQFASAQRWQPESGSSFQQIPYNRFTPQLSEMQKIKKMEKIRIEKYAQRFNIEDIRNVKEFYAKQKWKLSKNLKTKKKYAAGAMADVLFRLQRDEHKDKILKGVSETKLIQVKYTDDRNLELLMIYREYMIPQIIYKLISKTPGYEKLKKHIVLVNHIYTGEVSSQKVLFVEMEKMTGNDLNIALTVDRAKLDLYAICLQVFYIVSSLNRLKIMHGDVKPDNFKYNKKKKNVRIFDFGFSCIVTKNPQDLQYKLQTLYFKNLQCKEKYIGSIGYISPAIRDAQQGGKRAITSKFIFLKELYAVIMTCYVILTTNLYNMENKYNFLNENFPFPRMGILFHCVLQVSTWKDMLDRLKKFEVISPRMQGSVEYHTISSDCYDFLTK